MTTKMHAHNRIPKFVIFDFQCFAKPDIPILNPNCVLHLSLSLSLVSILKPTFSNANPETLVRAQSPD